MVSDISIPTSTVKIIQEEKPWTHLWQARLPLIVNGMLLTLQEYVIVDNAEKNAVAGKKLDQKIYYRHSEYVGGMKETTLKEMLAKHPERVIEHAVKGMLPKGPLGREMYKKLFVYAGPDHKHAAQKPETLTF